MRTIKLLTNNKFLNIKEVEDAKNNVTGYQFAERRGVDSIAFICYDELTKEFLLNMELKPPINKFVLGAFGGSMDKNKMPEEIVLDELKEEAGFNVDKEFVNFVGKVLVSSQMNQYCYLYLVFVNKDNQQERHPENEVEKLATTSWHSFNDISELEEWKPIVIIEKAKQKKII